jgi:hypothetical protein
MLLITAQLDSYRSLKDKTLKVVFETNEMTPEQHLALSNHLQQFGYLAFKKELFTDKEKEVIEDIKTDFNDNGKTPSQRLRAVLFLLFKNNPEGYEDFQLYYNFKLEKIINHFKSFLPD